jgi:hypothetical protein
MQFSINEFPPLPCKSEGERVKVLKPTPDYKRGLVPSVVARCGGDVFLMSALADLITFHTLPSIVDREARKLAKKQRRAARASAVVPSSVAQIPVLAPVGGPVIAPAVAPACAPVAAPVCAPAVGVKMTQAAKRRARRAKKQSCAGPKAMVPQVPKAMVPQRASPRAPLGLLAKNYYFPLVIAEQSQELHREVVYEQITSVENQLMCAKMHKKKAPKMFTG